MRHTQGNSRKDLSLLIQLLKLQSMQKAMLQVLGLTLLRMGSKKRVSVMKPPEHVYMEPYIRESASLPVNIIGSLGAWCVLRANRLASIRDEQGSIKVTAP